MPAIAIGKLHAILGINTGQFEAGLKSAQGKLGGFGKLATGALAGVAVAAAAAAVAISVAIKGQLNAADELGKTAQKIGVGVEALSRLKYAADLSDISLEQLSGGLKKLGVNMADVASGGTGKAAEAFATLGISVTDANGQLKSSDAVLTEVAGKFEGMRDGAQKTALAVALFGKSGSDLIPLLNEGAAGLKAMGDEAAQLGIVIDTKTAKAAEAFNDNLTRLKAAGTGVTVQLTAALAPALASISAAMVVTAKNAVALNAVGGALGATLRFLAATAVITGGAIAHTGTMIGGLLTALNTPVSRAGDAMKALSAAAIKGEAIAAATAAAVRAIYAPANLPAAAKAEKVAADLAAPITKAAGKTKAAAKQIKADTDKALEAARELVAAEQDSFDNRDRTEDQIRLGKLLAAASLLAGKGLREESDAASLLARELAGVVKVTDGLVVKTPSLTEEVADLAEGIARLERDTRTPLEKIADGFYEVSDAIQTAGRAFKAGDYVGALLQATKALDSIRLAFKKGADGATKFAAVAGVADAAGQLIGGRGGRALSGAASGAAAGAVFGVPGAIIGGLLGGALSLFGDAKARKRAKKEAAERARLEAENKAKAEAATRRELEIQLIEATGDALAARTEREKDLLALLSPANAELQKQVWLQTKAADLARERRVLETELLEASGKSAEALVMLREDALKALPPELRALQASIYAVVDASVAAEEAQTRYEAALSVAEGHRDAARDDLTEAYDREVSAIEAVRDRFADLADTLAEFARDLAGGDLAGLDPVTALAVARAAFDDLVGKTDEASLAALPAAGRALLDASRAAAPNALALARDMSAVRNAVVAGEQAARAQVSSADRQLTALQEQVAGLLTLNISVLSVRDAITALGASMAEVARIANDNVAPARGLTFNPAPAVAALSAVPTAAAIAPVVALADQWLIDIQPYLAQMVVNTGAAARILDDVSGGSNSLKTVAA